MRNSGILLFGGLLILIGMMILAGAIFNVNMWAYFWPVLLILLGLWLLVRPRWIGSRGAVDFLFFNNLRRKGSWQVKAEEIFIFIGDVSLDLSSADIPSGETVYHFYGFIGDVDLIVPQDVGVSVSSAGFVNDVNVFKRKQSSILFPIEIASDGYETAERKIRLDGAFFIGDVKIKSAS
jgi:hypothetical protein